ncbi:CPBP family intramembrane glutamic endopeptidase [Agrilactobacillus yilanensis]|uniref:CPBP family intramembrane glutamic endopeptidase n=1 Tax=Agrilactobacillus yilanensis TaxID=2485997 RepID=A0ABW4J950_9LACO|nr:type II CAAX endopeptidase family protein [Agrilactobacillus yilanensis]
MKSPQTPYQDGVFVKIGKFIGLLIALFLPQLCLLLPMYTKVPALLSWLLFGGSYFLLYVLYINFYHKYRTETIQKLDRKAWITIGWGYVVMFIAKFAFSSLNIAISHQQVTENDQAIMNLIGGQNRNIALMTIMMGVFFAPLAEELLFRGILMNMFFKHRFWLSVLLSGLVFGLSHSNSTWTGALLYIALGAILGFIYKRTNNLKITLVLHFLNNAPMLIYLFM